MTRRPPVSTRTDTLFPYATLFRSNATSPVLLDVQGLQTAFHTEAGAWLAVDGVDLTIECGEILGLVGESGSGKSVTGFSLLGLIDAPGEVVAGSVRFKGDELRGLRSEEHTSEHQSLMRRSSAVVCFKKNKLYHILTSNQ